MTIISPLSVEELGNYETISSPRIFKLVCTNSLAEVTAAGFINKVKSGQQILATDVFLIGYATDISLFKCSIDANKIVTLSLDSSIADGSITTAKLALAAVTTANILDGNVTTSKIADGAITTNKITDGNITLAKLSATAAPSDIVKYSGKYPVAGGSASITIPSVTGTLSTDKAFVNIQTSTNAVSVQKVIPGTDQISVQLSGDPGAAVLTYLVLRTAA
jgi:hypothetical protein